MDDSEKKSIENKPAENGWPLWEVFIRARQGLDHKHAGSLYAADAAMAIENARDVYTRRNEGISIWVVESKYIHASKSFRSRASVGVQTGYQNLGPKCKTFVYLAINALS